MKNSSNKKVVNKTQKKETKKTKKVQNKKIGMIVGGIVILLVVVALVVCSVSFVKNRVLYKPFYEIEERTEKIQNTKVEGNDVYGWLRVQGTGIDTPIIKMTSELEKNTEVDYLWTSTNYLEGQNRKVIYGHNIRNVSPYPDKVNPEHFRFEQLVSFVYEDFAKENLYIQYHDGKEEALYKIYAVSFHNSGDEFGQSYSDDYVSAYLEDAKRKSIYNYDVDVDEEDKLLSLITCTRYFGAVEKTQFRVDARKVRKNEKIVKYTVETNSNYDIIK